MGARERRPGTVIVSGGGVTVRKELVGDGHEAATIRVRLENDTAERKRVRLVETPPAAYSVATMEFRADRGADQWTREGDDYVAYERTLAPTSECETAYEVADRDTAAAFVTEPRLVVDGEVLADGGTADPASVPDGGSADGEADDGPAAGEADDGSANVGRNPPSLDADIPAAPTTHDDLEIATGDASGEGAGEIELSGPQDEADEPGFTPGPESGCVVERLVAELERDGVDAEQRRVLREQLDLGVPSVTKARLTRLSNRVEKVAAYADALEEFLDDEGTAQEAIADFETQVEALRGDVATIREEASANASDVAALEGEVGSLGDRVDDLAGTVADLSERIADLDDSLSTTDSRLEAIEGDLRQTECQVAQNATAVDELREWWDELGDIQ